MNQSTEHMIRIFKNLQTVAQTSSEGKISFQLEKCSLATLIKEALNFSSVMAQNKNIYFEFDQFDTEKEINVYVDRDVFIFQIFTNFITNSLKYSESGQKIRISLNLLDMKYAQISIRDWGQGIPPEKINDLFSWSTRTTTRGTAGEKGSGLGLPLANKFLKSMNGNLEIRSSLAAGAQRGTEIIITLPILEEMQKNSAA